MTAVSRQADLSISDDELYVEVGDTVTYCYSEKPNERLTVTIVDGQSVPQRNLTNENSPIAKALLNCQIGDETELHVGDNPPAHIKILKIQRQQDLWSSSDIGNELVENDVSIHTPPPLPSIGQKTNVYPFGYGYCQCGCGQITTMANRGGLWTWNKYIEGHESRRLN